MNDSTDSALDATIRFRLRELAQLFNSMDPSPFRERDLDANAEEFIVGWASELPRNRELKLVIHVATVPPVDRAAEVGAAVRHHFEQRTENKRRQFRQLLRRGRVSLVVGLLFLGTCLTIGQLLTQHDNSTFAAILRESFTIGDWVAMRRPLEIYLYDWWPLRADWRVLQSLCRMPVQLVLPDQPAPPAKPA